MIRLILSSMLLFLIGCDSDNMSSLEGCMDVDACNYSPLANIEDNPSCEYPGECDACDDGDVVNGDMDEDGVCDVSEIEGCMSSSACNYNAEATNDDSSCVFTDDVCDSCLDGAIIDNDYDNDGVCDTDEISGCSYQTACNYNSQVTDDDGSCIFIDGICETCENGEIVDNDIDNDATCDADEVEGCIDNSACNYNIYVSSDDSSCLYVDGICETCENSQIIDNDMDDDDVCDLDEIAGCTYDTACNYNPDATDEDNSCVFVDGICETCENGEIIDNDLDDDGICNVDEILGCIYDTACNYNAEATDDDNSCIFIDGVCETCENGEIIDNDLDDDTVCDEDEVEGCISDEDACNYNPSTTDIVDCTYVDGICETCENGEIIDNDQDDDSVCDE